MLKKYTFICLALICFNTQAQTTTQSEWDRNMKVLAETIPMFDIKIYESSNPDFAVQIKNYSIEDDFLVVSIWERATRTSKKSSFNLRCLKDIDLTCETSCTLRLVFDKAVASIQNNQITRIDLSNCEVLSKNSCSKTVWKPEDDFIRKTINSFKKISYLN